MKLPELKIEFSKLELPKTMQLSKHEFITDVKAMIDSHISTLERNSGNMHFKPYYDRLIKLFYAIQRTD